MSSLEQKVKLKDVCISIQWKLQSMIQMIYLFKFQVQYLKNYAESQTLSCQAEENTVLRICF